MSSFLLLFLFFLPFNPCVSLSLCICRQVSCHTSSQHSTITGGHRGHLYNCLLKCTHTSGNKRRIWTGEGFRGQTQLIWTVFKGAAAEEENEWDEPTDLSSDRAFHCALGGLSTGQVGEKCISFSLHFITMVFSKVIYSFHKEIKCWPAIRNTNVCEMVKKKPTLLVSNCLM